ncbi:MAG: hypothetical protein JST67_00050 [Bacteroidetes bacterium]|nr:hypothetical protein [Bacteroidota bacterium]
MKALFSSKAFWLNFIAGIIAILLLVNPELLNSFGLTPTKQQPILTTIGFIVAVLNIILHILSTSNSNKNG